MVSLFGAANAAPNKGVTILYWFRSPKTVLNPPVNGEIQGLFKAFECFSSTFHGKFYFQGLFKTVLYIQVLFKPVRTLVILEIKRGKHKPRFLSNMSRNARFQSMCYVRPAKAQISLRIRSV